MYFLIIVVQQSHPQQIIENKKKMTVKQKFMKIFRWIFRTNEKDENHALL